MLKEVILFFLVLGLMLTYNHIPPILQYITIFTCGFLFLKNLYDYIKNYYL